MTRRIISRKEIEKAYKREVDYYEEQFEESHKDNIDELPDEMFQILGKIVSFIENTDKTEGEKNENKQ